MENDVTFQREEYAKNLPRWELVEDCCEGQDAIKAKKETYLPKPNPSDKSKEADARYGSYLARAIFFNATGRTLDGTVGLAFNKDPELQHSDDLEYIADDIDGKGLSIYQHSQQTTECVMKTGFYGLLVDYPRTDRQLSKAEAQAQFIRSTLAAYPAKTITNWRTERIGGKHMLSLVVLMESDTSVTPDGFGTKTETQYRVLKLVQGVYTVEIWKKKKDENTKKMVWQLDDSFAPKKSNGSTWREIPFKFVGAKNNDAMPDKAPLYDIANTNLGHYRNSADYEEGVFIHGQGTLFVDIGEFSYEDYKKANPQGLQLGARAGNLLGKGGQAVLIQADANDPALEAMKHKEDQMIALGAQMITSDGQVKTATEAGADNSKSNSVLSLVCANVSEAYTQCLYWMGEFMGSTFEYLYEINQEFTVYTLDSNIVTALVQLWQTGEYPSSDLWSQLRKYGLIDAERPDEDIKDELETQGGGLGLENEQDLPGQ